jgi:hypothetical protein
MFVKMDFADHTLKGIGNTSVFPKINANEYLSE